MDNKRVLDSWKEISRYLRRSVSTCQRWERELGLPIKRLDGSPKARVFAYSEELDRWLEAILKSGEISREKRHAFSSIKAKIIAISFAVILIVTLGIVFWQQWSKKNADAAIFDKPSLAILYFKNNTGSQDFDHFRETLSDLLNDDLSQSKYIYVLPKDHLYTILSKMDLLETQNYTTRQLEEIATRGAVDHLITGSYAKAGDTFRITITLIKARSGKLLTTERAEDVEENIFPLIDALTKKIKPHLVLSGEKIADDIDESLRDITTASAEAYKYYKEGQKHTRKAEWELAVPYLERAVSIDPGFGMAYRSLYMAYIQLGNQAKREESILKAYEAIHRVSERERLHILAAYQHFKGERDASIGTYEKLLLIYPEDATANNNLGSFYNAREEFDKAIERLKIPVNNKSEVVHAYDGLANSYCGLGEYEKAIEVLEKYLINVSDNWLIHWRFSQIHFITGNYGRALQEADKANEMNPHWFFIILKGNIYQCMWDIERAENTYRSLMESEKDDARLEGILALASLYYQQGQFAKAKDLLAEGFGLAMELNNEDYQDLISVRSGLLYLRLKNPRRALEEYNKIAIQSYRSSHLLGLVHLSLDSVAKAYEESKKLYQLLEKENNPKLIRHYHHLLGMIEHKKGNLFQALEHFKKAEDFLPFQKPFPRVEHPLFLQSLAEVYREMGDLKNARSVSERITRLTIERINMGDIYALAFYNLGRVCEEQGEKTNAIANYKKFLDLWKKADPSLAEVKEAKKKLDDLKSP